MRLFSISRDSSTSKTEHHNPFDNQSGPGGESNKTVRQPAHENARRGEQDLLPGEFHSAMSYTTTCLENNTAADDFFDAAREPVRVVDARQQADPPQAIPAKSPYYDYGRVTFSELVSAKYETEWVVPSMIVARQPLIMAGGKKTLKTSIALDLAISISLAKPFLGAFEVPTARRVAMMTGESGIETIQETALRICEAKKIADPASVDADLVLFKKLPRFGDEKHLLSLRRLMTNDAVEVLIIDPVYLCMPGADAANLMIQGQLLCDISELCQEIGVTMILLHHTKKNVANRFEAPELDDIAWAGFAEFARQWLLLGRREPFAPGDMAGMSRLWLSVGGSSGQSMLKALDISEGCLPKRRWVVNVFTAKEARSAVEDRKADTQDKEDSKRFERKVEAHKKKLFAALAKFPDGETKSQIAIHAGLNSANSSLALSAALESGEVVVCKVLKGNKKTAVDGYKLATERDGSAPVGQVRQDQPDSLSDS